MKVSNNVLIGLAVIGGGYLWVKNYADKVIGNIDQKFAGVKWLGIKNLRAGFMLTYTVTNKNTESIKIYGFKGTLTWRNTKFANIGTSYTNEKPLVLTSNQKQDFIIYFDLPLVDVFADLAKLLFGSSPGSTHEGLYIRGTLDVSVNSIRGGIPMDQPIVLTI